MLCSSAVFVCQSRVYAAMKRVDDVIDLKVSVHDTHCECVFVCVGHIYRRTAYKFECLIIENCEGFFTAQLLHSRNVLLVYTRMRKPYTNAVIYSTMHAKMLEPN